MTEDTSVGRVDALQIELPVFTGPFRLLADLILDHKVDVCDVPLARITDAFLTRGSQELSTWSLEETTWFVAIGAVLVEMKVGRLLPRPDPETEEELLGGVSPDLLYARSLELAAFRRVSEDLARAMAEAALMVARPAGFPSELAHLYPDPMEKVTPELLASAAASLLATPPVLDLGHVTPIRVSLADALRTMERQLVERNRSVFRDLVDDCRDRIEVVIRFLALLELYRQGKVDVRQAGPLGEIEVTWRDVDRGSLEHR